jgi:phosphate:Na+ symporter
VNTYTIIAPMLGGLGLFFIGIRSLSANLVPLVGNRARARFAQALRGPVSSAVSGVIAGLLTQSSTAASWIVLGLIRAGLKPSLWVLVAPAWSNVGTALLPLLVAINLATSASYVIGLVGFAIYFKLDSTDRRRFVLDAAFGAALLLFGMQIVSGSVDPVRVALSTNRDFALVFHSALLLAAVGAGLSLLTQSSSVAAAIAVAGLNNGLLTVPAALPLIAAANFAGIFNNLLKIRTEEAAGRTVFALQLVQKAGGTVVLSLIAIGAALYPEKAAILVDMTGRHASGQIAVIFTIAQLIGALTASAASAPVTNWMARWRPPTTAEALAQPIFLLREALSDPAVALDLAMQELARLTLRVPMLLDHVRDNPDATSPLAPALKVTGIELAQAIKIYLTSLLDNPLARHQVAVALLLENATGNVAALHEALADLAAAAADAAGMAEAGRLVEALHVLMGFVADHAQNPGQDDPAFILKMLGDRNAMMMELRGRLAADTGSAAQAALFRMTIMFERSVWLARRLITDLSQAHAVLTS